MRALAVLAFVLAPALAHAEVIEKGVHGGPHLFTFRQNNDSGQPNNSSINATPGFAFGGYLALRISDLVSFQTEGQLAVAKAFEEHCSPCMTIRELTLWFFEVPALLRFDMIPGDRTKVHIEFGPELVIAMGGRQVAPMAPEQALDLQPANLGALVGLGFEIPAGTGRITIDVRYQRFAGKIASGLESSHQLFTMVGYAFP